MMKENLSPCCVSQSPDELVDAELAPFWKDFQRRMLMSYSSLSRAQAYSNSTRSSFSTFRGLNRVYFKSRGVREFSPSHHGLNRARPEYQLSKTCKKTCFRCWKCLVCFHTAVLESYSPTAFFQGMDLRNLKPVADSAYRKSRTWHDVRRVPATVLI